MEIGHISSKEDSAFVQDDIKYLQNGRPIDISYSNDGQTASEE